MDWRTFIADLISSLAWPAVALIIALILRKPLMALVSRDRGEFSVGSFSWKWERLAEEVQADAGVGRRASLPGGQPTLDDEGGDSRLGDLVDLAQSQPLEAIVKAHEEVRAALAKLVEEDGATVAPDISLMKLARAASDQGLISPESLRAVEGMNVMRNMAVHDQIPTTPERAVDFVRLTEATLYPIESPPNRPAKV
ncbi:MAG: hypothetical protein ACPGWS_03620 [Solirubrobacterales bacterium]